MEGEDLMSMTAAERKALAREAKRKKQEELQKNQDKFEFEEYNVQKKAQHSQAQKERQERERREKEEKEKEHRKNQQKAQPHQKLSKPEPARSPFIFFKEAHPKMDAEQLKTAWANLPEAEKQTYKNKSVADKQREKEEKEKWQEAQALKDAQKNSKKGKERR